MNFVAVFECVGYTDKAGLTKRMKDEQRIVEAEDMGSARKYAERFQNIALNWTYGIRKLKSVRVATDEDTRQCEHLSELECIYPDR